MSSVIWRDPIRELPIFCGCENEIKLHQNQCTQSSINAFIINNIEYSLEANNGGYQGKVWVNFLVSKTGNVKDVKLLKGIHKSLDDPVITVIKKLPDFLPGTQSGKPINMWITLPIVFGLR